MPIAQTTKERTPSDRVLESAQYISKHSKEVHVPEAGARHAAREIMKRMQSTGYCAAEWKKHALNPSVANDDAVEWIFVVDALNFSFWTDKVSAPEKRYTVTLDGTAYQGYWTLCASVNRALREGIPMTDATFYASVSEQELARIFRTDDPEHQEPAPLLAERLQVLYEVGAVLRDKYGGKFANVIKQCEGSAQRLVELIVRDFPCFRDEHRFNGRTVQLYKRAQILVADVWACFEGTGHGSFYDIDAVTMFADYRVPQALCHFGALAYSDQLLEFLSASERAVDSKGEKRTGSAVSCPPKQPGLLASGHPWEIEIRGNSIWAVEQIRRIIAEAGIHVNAILIDFYLWDYAKEHSQSMRSIPIHLTRSIFY
ncbi:hypothetical protein IW140_004768 [Coemansia sp. RSA 1813]|nr:hypothetical protein EV178_004774 [Coemansia sp. RSA 1646]KAJ1768998.1 hypothetical protein LPJ74_004428 [Coemansia sp. RSA 1843]KAJ2212548.1 hypothetical protein EV179_004600 [Coemansia sp. RSA 487]KAJ2566905.1 hypothetical protein IW140_004768 [Coemansia sp. RSA 1813]